jgi:hypothetical protein
MEKFYQSEQNEPAGSVLLDEEFYAYGIQLVNQTLYKDALLWFKSINKNSKSNFKPEIKSLENFLKIRDQYLKLFIQGRIYLINSKYSKAYDKFQKASNKYLEPLNDEIFVKLNSGDLTKYTEANEAQVYLEKANLKITRSNLKSRICYAVFRFLTLVKFRKI